ncbi:MAG: hypothetical protein GWO16_06235, partial [Gammaproteobacteria bacterium]|nr:hypothetical protein [Gammaproteobacteria bacterium]NIR97639.1 hypothetical protein [Gammaproteobacteria bacterium]NIT63289.1 hypothetical protein [Gammaproteobacteria bacterium]NIV20218.1 hypothetical protein [Gammaproteobacteria bacterium]NIY31869.1 hypothetical protein [Gammaproteobacteria bacterium]
PANAPEEAAAREEVEIRRRRERALARAYEQRRRPESALRDLLACIREEGDGLEVHRWFHRELAQWNDRRVALAHARVFIPRLLEAGRTAEAEQVFGMCRAVNAEFEIGDATAANAGQASGK